MNTHILNMHVVIEICLIGLLAVTPIYANSDYDKARKDLIHQIENDVRRTETYFSKSTFSSQVMEAMATVPRHKFVPEIFRYAAYENQPLPIGYGQTISQPYIVALMTDLLSLSPGDKALEVGTGSGYQAAILAELVDEVYTIEIIEELGKQATTVLASLKYNNVHTRIGDGYYGWQEHSPFDAIVVTAAASHIPPPLIRQLKPGGRMVIPVGSRFMVQQLVLVEKDDKGKVSTRQILPVMFVPLTGKHD